MKSTLETSLLEKGSHNVKRSSGRHSLTNRISSNVVRRLSVFGVAEETRNGSLIGTAFNTLCNVIGAGVLSLPLAMYEASVLGALLLMAYSTLLAGFAVFAIITGCDVTQRFSFTEVMAFVMFPPLSFENFSAKSSRIISENFEVESGAMEMEELRMQHANDELLRRKRRRLVTVLVELVVFLNNYGSLIIYSRVIADSIPPVVSSFLHGHGIFVSRIFWLLASGVVFFLLSCVRNMEELKWTSLLGFLTIFYIVLTVFVRYFTSICDPSYPTVDPADYGSINWSHISTGIFRTMSTYGVAFGYHYNVPYFYRELKDRRPETMMKTVYIAFPVIVICYIITGVFGYLTFGNLVSDTAAGGDIVRNYPSDDPVVNVGRLGLFLHFACVYPILSICARRGLHRLIMHALTWREQTARMNENLQFVRDQNEGRETVSSYINEDTPVNDIDRDVGCPEDTTWMAIVLEAFFIVSTTVLLAALISGIGMVIDILGTLFGIFLMLTGPGLVGWMLFSRTQLSFTTPYRYIRFFLCFSMLLVVTGTVFTFSGVVFLIKIYVT